MYETLKLLAQCFGVVAAIYLIFAQIFPPKNR